MSEDPKSATRLSIDWERFGEFLFQFVAGIGLGIFWLGMVILTVLILIWGLVQILSLSFAWILGIAAAVPLVIFVWWLCFHVALDGLSDIGIKLEGVCSWLVIPVAPVLALLSFVFMYVSGLGRFARKPMAAYFSFGLGIVLLLVLSLKFLLRI